MPSGRIIPGGALQGRNNATILFEIPIDDENTATYSVRYSSEPLTRESRLVEMGFDDPEFYCEKTQKFLFTRNDFHRQRRDLMDHNWSGFRGIATEDMVISVSMGPIPDRTKEHLIASDLAVARFRRRVLDSAERVEGGQDPIGVHADASLITAIDTQAPQSGHWRSLIPSHRVDAAA
jgi:phthalate 4,5-dioxygenase oxygenase subunit